MGSYIKTFPRFTETHRFTRVTLVPSPLVFIEFLSLFAEQPFEPNHLQLNAAQIKY